MQPERMQELIEAYRVCEVPSLDGEQRMLAGVEGKLAAGVVPSAAVDLSPKAVLIPASSASHVVAWSLTAGVALAVAVLAGVFASGGQSAPPPESAVPTPGYVGGEQTAQVPQARAAPEPKPDSVVEPELEVKAPTAAAPSPDTAAAGSRRRRARSKPSAAPRPSKAPTSSDPVVTVDAEVRLIKKARAAQRYGRHTRALALLEQHRSRFPNGAMAELREVFRVAALCAVGRTAAAGRAAQAFKRAYPKSPHGPRVHAACGSRGTGNTGSTG